MNKTPATAAPALPLKPAQQQAVRRLNRLCWLYFWLLIVEGALRKWFLPQYSAPLLIVRDPVLLAMYWIALDQGLFPRGPFITALVWLGVLSLLLALVQTITLNIPPHVLVYGLRANYLHLPLIFLLPSIFTFDDVRRMGRWILIIAVPMAILMAYQFNSAPGARINRTVGLGVGEQLSSAMGRIRPAGTFSFVNGPVAFYALVTAFIGYAATGGRLFPSRLFLIPPLVALGLAVSVSGSRATILSGGIVLLAWFFSIAASRRITEGVGRTLVLAIIAVFILTQIDIVKEGTEVLSARWEIATGSERASGGLLTRILNSFRGPLVHMFDVPWFGMGLGVGTNVGAALITGRAQFLLSEGEWGRVLMEMGPFLGLAFVIYRVALTVWLGKRCVRAAAAGNMLPLLIYSACAVAIFNGQIAQPTTLGFTVLGGGLCLAAMNAEAQASSPQTEKPAGKPVKKKYRIGPE